MGGLPNPVYEIQSHHFKDKPSYLFSRLVDSHVIENLSKGVQWKHCLLVDYSFLKVPPILLAAQ